MSTTDTRYMKHLQPGYQRAQRERRKALVDAAFHLAFVVRENIGRRGKRYAVPTKLTMKLDRIRAALARFEEMRAQ